MHLRYILELSKRRIRCISTMNATIRESACAMRAGEAARSASGCSISFSTSMTARGGEAGAADVAWNDVATSSAHVQNIALGVQLNFRQRDPGQFHLDEPVVARAEQISRRFPGCRVEHRIDRRQAPQMPVLPFHRDDTCVILLRKSSNTLVSPWTFLRYEWRGLRGRLQPP